MAKPTKHHRKKKKAEPADSTELRIIGGNLRGSKLRYEHFQQGGDPVTRPMKHRVREAIFNLISIESAGKHVIDLFAGTGALGLEALSRGSLSATFIERHVPTARVIEENIAMLGLTDRSQLLVTSAFLWAKRDLPNADSPSSQPAVPNPSIPLPWLVFCSPPYSFYSERQQEMLDLIEQVLDRAPAESILVVEADTSFDFNLLRGGVADTREENCWLVRSYPPAVVGIWRK
ncbi:RsmD family RNA methyltransferase [Bythopirellula polymerisocia]|uniref:RsmD family RNA methyltransferase n=1 Tax=Bythopirellula polymerisocia TaxID=2528003 RepID=UPI0018D34670|nr:RsmD family RNA methyltransferase [Bythopirellula polymerisocia]